MKILDEILEGDEYLFFRDNEESQVWWVEYPADIGEFLFSFDQKKYITYFWITRKI